MRNWIRLLPTLPLVALLAACSPAPAADTPQSTAQPQATMTVGSDAVVVEPLVRNVQANGTVQATQEVVVSAVQAGEVISVDVSKGDTVKTGQILIRLGSEDIAAQITEQDALLSSRRISLSSAEATNTRNQSLLQAKAISVQTAETAASTLALARADVAQAQAALDRLQIQKDQSLIFSPVDGLVIDLVPVVGQYLQAGTAALTVVRDGQLEVAAQVPEFYLTNLHIGDAVTVHGLAGNEIAGKVRTIAKFVDEQTRLAEVTVQLPADSALLKGQFARIVFSITETDSPTVDSNAIVWRGGKPGVFTIAASGEAQFVAVEIGSRANGRTAITGSVSAGDKVAVAGAGFLNPGDHVALASDTPVVTGAL